MYLRLYFLFIFLIYASCSKLEESEKTDQVVKSAHFLLTDGKCQEAIELLEEYGRNNNHAGYVMALSSAYACRSGFTEAGFFNSLTSLDVDPANLLSSLVGLSTSVVRGIADTDFADLKMATEILLNAGEPINPSAALRLEKFGSSDGNEINIQLFYMILAQMGKYAYFFGNADPDTGVKGAGNINNNTNVCFTEYHENDIEAVVTGAGNGACNSVNPGAGHPSMSYASVGETLFVKRMCEGVTLMNNFFDVFGAVTLSSASQFGDLGTLQGNISTLFNNICSVSLTGFGHDGTAICNTRSMNLCISEYGNYTGGTDTLNSGTNSLEAHVFFTWETLLQ